MADSTRIAELEALSHDELYTVAQELELDGRSKMSDPDLITAIAELEAQRATGTSVFAGDGDTGNVVVAAGADDDQPKPSTPEQIGRPTLLEVAQQRANRQPHRVIGAANNPQED